MNDLAKRWIEALRSGDYKQSGGGLRYEDSFCCHGVLCDVHGGGEWEGEYYVYDSEYRSGLPQRKIRVAVGLTPEQQDKLAEMNDHGISFEEIADEAERMLS